MKKFALLLMLMPILAFAQTPDSRYCYQPEAVPRYLDGTIKRSTTVRNQFRTAHACPVTGLTTGTCPGWSVDHVIPLVCGGCDAVSNMQWLPNTIKACAGTECKDRWEIRVYCISKH